MKVVIQRSKKSEIIIDNKLYNKIDFGLVLLVGFTDGDTLKEIDYCIKKIVNLRIFSDERGLMNKSILDLGGSILSNSQFTLYADTKSGHRPGFTKAMNPSEASILFDTFNERLNELVPTYPGIFGSDALLNIQNDGPVTIIIDTNNL